MTNDQIISIYSSRKMTIMEIAKAAGRSYWNVRRVLVRAGFQYGQKH